MQVEAIPIGEWINTGSPKDTWFRIIRRLFFRDTNKTEIDMCIKSIKDGLKLYGKYELRQPAIPFDGFRVFDDCFFIGYDISEEGKYIVTVFTEARIIE